jgi:predicted aspartyl protease
MRAARSFCRLAPLAAALLILAGVRVGADEPPPEAVLAELPFLDFPEPNRIIVDLAPEGSAKPLKLMLDTGSAVSVMTPLAARELGVSVRRVKKDASYRRPTRLGRDLLFGVETLASDTGAKTSWEYGFVGGNFLAEYVVEIDFPRRRVRLLDPKRYQVPASVIAPQEAVLPIQVVSNRPSIEVTVDGAKLPVVVGTGVPWSAVFSGPSAKRAGLEAEKIAGLAARSVFGPLEVELSEAAQLAIGPFEFHQMPLLVAPKGWYNLQGPSESVIGYDLLSQFVVRLDYANQRLWLRRDPEAKLTFIGADIAVFREDGLLLIPKLDHFYAYIVRPESAAARRGLRQGDWIAGKDEQAIAAALREGKELTVIRQVNGIGVDTVLEAVAPSSAVSAPPNP